MLYPKRTTAAAFLDLLRSPAQLHTDHALYNLFHSQDLTPLIDELTKHGFRTLSFFKSGCNALLFKSTEGQLIRICSKQHISLDSLKEAASHPAILQPIDQFPITLGGKELVISVMPAIRTYGVTYHHQDKLREALAEAGIEVRELNPANIGLIDIPKYGIHDLPMLIDTGTAEFFSNKNKKQKTLINEWCASSISGIQEGTPWQQVFDARIGTGKASGVVDDNTLDTLEKENGKDNGFVKALDNGAYINDLTTIFR